MSRTIAIGDIHGCSIALAVLLDAIKVQSTDTIVTLGDYIDWGPDSNGVIDTLIDLESRCHLVPILGNHDQMLLEVRAGRYPIYWLLEIGGVATFNSYGGQDLDLVPDSHYRFFSRCRDFVETKTHIFTHGNYYHDLAMDDQPAGVLRWESLRDMVPEPHVSGKTVIVGHTSQKNGEILNLGHLICIDTYVYGNGWLSAFDVDSGQVWQANQAGQLSR